MCQVVFSFLEDLVYKGVYDGPIRTSLRCNHGVFDVLGHADVKEHWEKVIQPEAERFLRPVATVRCVPTS